jgi:comEA protein
MFNLERQERIIVIFLVSCLILGLAVVAYKKLHSDIKIRIAHFNVKPAAPDSEAATKALININTARAKELEDLKGVGPSLAGRIVDYRQKHGLFLSKEDIKKVSGIGEGLYNKIKDQITIE